MSDPAAALRSFVARVAPFDEPGAPVVATVSAGGATFPLTARSARAFAEALHRYADPDDHGRCADCGGLLDRNLHCASCGRVDGVFGETLARYAAGHRGDNG